MFFRTAISRLLFLSAILMMTSTAFGHSPRRWTGVASSADGSKLVALTLGQIYTSTDSGVSWTPHDSVRGWTAVASSADGNKIVAVELGGQIYTSGPTTSIGTAGSLVGAQYASVELQYVGNGLFIPISWVGTIGGNKE